MASYLLNIRRAKNNPDKKANHPNKLPDIKIDINCTAKEIMLPVLADRDITAPKKSTNVVIIAIINAAIAGAVSLIELNLSSCSLDKLDNRFLLIP